MVRLGRSKEACRDIGVAQRRTEADAGYAYLRDLFNAPKEALNLTPALRPNERVQLVDDDKSQFARCRSREALRVEVDFFYVRANLRVRELKATGVSLVDSHSYWSLRLHRRPLVTNVRVRS